MFVVSFRRGAMQSTAKATAIQSILSFSPSRPSRLALAELLLKDGNFGGATEEDAPGQQTVSFGPGMYFSSKVGVQNTVPVKLSHSPLNSAVQLCLSVPLHNVHV